MTSPKLVEEWRERLARDTVRTNLHADGERPLYQVSFRVPGFLALGAHEDPVRAENAALRLALAHVLAEREEIQRGAASLLR